MNRLHVGMQVFPSFERGKPDLERQSDPGSVCFGPSSRMIHNNFTKDGMKVE